MDTKILQCLNLLTPFLFFINLATIQSPLFIYCSWTLVFNNLQVVVVIFSKDIKLDKTFHC